MCYAVCGNTAYRKMPFKGVANNVIISNVSSIHCDIRWKLQFILIGSIHLYKIITNIDLYPIQLMQYDAVCKPRSIGDKSICLTMASYLT